MSGGKSKKIQPNDHKGYTKEPQTHITYLIILIFIIYTQHILYMLHVA